MLFREGKGHSAGDAWLLILLPPATRNYVARVEVPNIFLPTEVVGVICKICALHPQDLGYSQ